MKDKLKGYKDEANLTDDQIIRRAEAQKADLTDIDPETSVAKGDEKAPAGTGEYADKMKTLYGKSKQNRDLVQRKESENVPDVEMIQRMAAEAAGGERPVTEIDTNKPDRFAADRGEETEEQYAARLIKEQEEQGDEVPQKESKSADKSVLPDPESNATVEVQILGRVLTVPKQDVDDAGGIVAYQKSRSATLRLQRAATLEEQARALLAKSQSEQGQNGAQIADPSTDGLSEADIESLYEEMMDVVVDGTEDDQRAWIKKLQQRQSQKKSTPAPREAKEPQAAKKDRSEIQKELEAQLEADRVEANQMMIKDYPDIMGDTELLGLAKQRFNVIKANPNNEGRTQKEMAREAANFVRTLGQRVGGAYRQPNTVEAERQTRIERKRQLPQQSHADHPAPARPSQDNKVPSRKEHFQRLRQMQGHQE